MNASHTVQKAAKPLPAILQPQQASCEGAAGSIGKDSACAHIRLENFIKLLADMAPGANPPSANLIYIYVNLLCH